MTIPTRPILDAMVSHAAASGRFRRVNAFEPKAAPGAGLTCAVWADTIAPARGGSGLDATTVKLAFIVRVYQGMILDPPDAIEPSVIDAVDTLMGAYSGDFTLGDLVREVDLLGHFGDPLSARAGYIGIDNKMFRVMDVYVPLILNDVYEQEA